MNVFDLNYTDLFVIIKLMFYWFITIEGRKLYLQSFYRYKYFEFVLI